MDEKCKGFFGRARCNFEARFDDLPPTPELVRASGDAWPLMNVKLRGADVYVRDICTACGETRERPAKKNK